MSDKPYYWPPEQSELANYLELAKRVWHSPYAPTNREAEMAQGLERLVRRVVELEEMTSGLTSV